MNSLPLILIICFIVFCIAIYLITKYIKGPIDRAPVKMETSNIQPILIKTLDVQAVNTFFSKNQEIYQQGYDDAFSNESVENLHLGLNRIKSDGNFLCDNVILTYQQEVRKIEQEIKEENDFLRNAGTEMSTGAQRKIVQKDNIQKIIKYIEEKKTSLNNDELGLYSSYKSGFTKGRNDKKK